MHATPRMCAQKPKKCPQKNVMHLWKQFQGRSLPVIAHTQPQTSKGKFPVVEQLFGMYIIRIHHLVSSYELAWKKEVKKKDERN